MGQETSRSSNHSTQSSTTYCMFCIRIRLRALGFRSCIEVDKTVWINYRINIFTAARSAYISSTQAGDDPGNDCIDLEIAFGEVIAFDSIE
jgi:hypothetical protein